MTDVGSARVEVTGDVRQFARQTERDLNRALSRMKVDPVKPDVDVDKSKVAATFIGAGTDAAGAMTAGLSKGLSGLSGILGSNPYITAAGVTMAVVLVAALLPAIGALLSGAVIALGGLSVIGLGALLLREEPALQAAAKSLTGSLKKVFSDAAKPLLGPLVAALKTFQGLVVEIGPQIKAMFAGLAGSGAIEALATGLAGLVKSTLPGFLELIKASGPFLKALGDALPILGDGMSRFFSAIAAGGPGAAVFFRDFFVFLGNVIAGLGTFLGWLSSVYPSVRQFFVDMSGWIQGAIQWITQFGASVAAVFAPLLPVIAGVWLAIASVVITAWKVMVQIVQTGIAVIRGVIAAVSAAIRGDWASTWAALKSIVAAILGGIRATISTTMSGIRATVSAALSAIRSAWSIGWNGMISTITGAASRIRSAVNGIRSTIIGAFSAAGSWLVNAGRAIISGLISGIKSMFGPLGSALSEAAQYARDHWPFSPAKIGPLSGRGDMRFAGQHLMEGLARGIGDRQNEVARAVSEAASGLPGLNLGVGSVKGGDGASAASPRTAGAPITVNITITGQGREAGEAAAEAVLERLAQAVAVR